MSHLILSPFSFPSHPPQEWSFNLPVCVAQAVEILWTPSPLPHTRTHPEDHLQESLWLACGASGIKVPTYTQTPHKNTPFGIKTHVHVLRYFSRDTIFRRTTIQFLPQMPATESFVKLCSVVMNTLVGGMHSLRDTHWRHGLLSQAEVSCLAQG